MFKYLFIFALLINCSKSIAEAPIFDYGYGESEFKWGAEIPLSNEKSDFKLRVGTRIQALMENLQNKDLNNDNSSNLQDFYIRRARLQVEAKFKENITYYMDIRADKIDRGESGKNAFAIGDAYIQVKDLFGNESLRLKLFRAKYDVSRSQTVSSSRILLPNRASISNFAGDFISKGRRGTNIQLLGNWANKIKTQLVIGDGIKDSGFTDAHGEKGAEIQGQSFAHGARVRISPFNGWEEKKLTETHFGLGQHFSISAGAFLVNNIKYETDSGENEIDRRLYNFDVSFHYGLFSLTGEYFIFDGVVEDFAAATPRVGKSDGWSAQAELALPHFHYIAPFARYQTWDRFKDTTAFEQNAWAAGVNYYLKGNKIRLGGYFEETEYKEGLANVLERKKETLVSLNLMMHY